MTALAPTLGGRTPGSRDQNLGALFTAILTRGPISRRDAARVTGLSAGAVTRLARPMISHGYVIEGDVMIAGPGRPQIPLAVDPGKHHAIGVKVMHRELVGVVVDLHADIKASRRLPLRDMTPPGVARGVKSLTDQLLALLPEVATGLLGVGVGLGGHVDGAAGVLRRSSHLDWSNVPLRRLLEDELSLPVLIENDVNTLALSEQWFGPGRHHSSFVVVTVGAGVGCGLVIGGELWRGTSGAAGEFGHIVVSPGGTVCSCGKRGCLESVASDAAIVQAVSERSGQPASHLRDAVRRALAGDPIARQVFTEAGTALGRGLSVIVNLLNPSLVILSGEGVSATDLYIDALRAELERDAFSTAARDCDVLVHPLPDEAWAQGAAATMVREGVLQSLTALSEEVLS